VELGLATFSAAAAIGYTGDFSTTSSVASYTHEKQRPGSSFTRCTRQFRISTYDSILRRDVRTNSFWFRLDYEYDGNDLRGVAIVPLKDKSSTLIKSKFNIIFEPIWLSAREDPVAEIQFKIRGTWTSYNPPPIPDDSYSLWGELNVRANGDVKIWVGSEKDRVRFDVMTNSCPITAPYVPIKKSYSLPILFRFNKDNVSETYARQMSDWVFSWPRETQEKVANGDITVHIEGFASRPGKGLYNLRLSERRLENTTKILRGFTGSNTKFDTHYYGAYRQNLPGLLDVTGWIRRFLDPNKYDQAAVIWLKT
jgi:outer membrane protein OmpA-like peptidoglycan-associated protein